VRVVHGSVIVVGSVNVDLVVRSPRLPAAGETVSGGTFERHGGGKGANQAVAAARSAVATRLVAAVGADESGDSALAELAADGVDVRGCLRLPDAPTGVALIVVDPSGANQIAVASGANAALDAAGVERALSDVVPDPGDVVLVGFEVGEEAVLAAAGWARRHGLRLVVDPAPARRLPPDLLACRPLLKPNQSEAAALSGTDDAGAAAARLAEASGVPVVVTLGAGGALLHEGGRTTRFPGHAVPVVDTTGAGDAFSGILAAELARGRGLEEALRRAVAGSALATTVAGAREGMPRPDAVDRLLAGA
jgi:ribokinase